MSTCASLLHKLSSRALHTEYSTSHVKTQSYFKDQPVHRCEMQEMRRLNYFFEISDTFFCKNKRLGFSKKFRINEEKSQACCHAEHKNKVSRLAISKIMTKHQNRAWKRTYIVLHIDQF